MSCRCNACLGVWVMVEPPDGFDTPEAPWCPYCGSNESLTLRSPFDSLADAVSHYAMEESA